MKKGLRNRIIRGNIIKNILIIVIAVWAITPLTELVSGIDAQYYDSVLFFDSLVLLAALFGCFSFTYEESHMERKFDRDLAHFTTGLLMLVSLIMLELAVIIMNAILGEISVIFVLLIAAIYVAIIGYDFWDLFRKV